MAGVGDLILLPPEVEVEAIEALDSVPFWYNDLEREIYGSDSDTLYPDFTDLSSLHQQILECDVEIEGGGFSESSYLDSDSDSNFFDVEDQVRFGLNLFHHCAQQMHVVESLNSVENLFIETVDDSNFRVFEGNVDVGPNNSPEIGLEFDRRDEFDEHDGPLELGLGLGLDRHDEFDEHGDTSMGLGLGIGLEFDRCDEFDEHDASMMLGLGLGLEFDRHDEFDEHDAPMDSSRGDGFSADRQDYVSEGGESYEGHSVEHYVGGLQIVGFGSDSEEDEERIHVTGIYSDGEDDMIDMVGDDPSLPLCWDSIHLEDRRDSNEDLEWEEVDGRVDEREILNMIEFDEGRFGSSEIQSEHGGIVVLEAARNHDWEVLLAVNDLERNLSLDQETGFYMEAPEDYIYTTENDMLFGQFAENDNSLRGNPPAAKSVVDNLLSVVITQKDVENNNALCAVCKDEIPIEEQAKRLPCSHHYHGDCILPWLSIRNTCPVCRYELPTDDPDYERGRTQRATRGLTGNSRVRYNH
ncbi:uncharacterized protein LOC143851544 [Tasmannia lanceolata]|uniref:uncharacterized protein LOC143851544 n=1 Tax=Tasmannia lanceolata TaxID=3420 RepID=UPI0040629885